MIVGVEYLSAGNRGADPDTQLDRDFQYFKAHGINYVQVRIVWAGLFNNNRTSPDESVLDNYRRYVKAAERAGILLGITPLWTQPPHDSSSGNNFFPSWIGSLRNLCTNATVKQQALDWVEYIVRELDSSAVAFWQTMNEPYGSYTEDIENFIRDMAAAIRRNSGAPISCRFIAGWNPCTVRWGTTGSDYRAGSYFNPSVMQYLDFLSLTIYFNPDSSDTAWNNSSRASWNDLQQTIENCRVSFRKSVYVVEFGWATGSYGNVDFSEAADETQRAKVAAMIAKFVSYGLNSCALWDWQSRSWNLENYNVCKGIASPRPAFFELQAVSDIPVKCLIDADCPAGYTCVNGECVRQEQPPQVDCNVASDCTVKHGAPAAGYHWECVNNNCVQVEDPVTPPPHKSFAARTIGPFGVPASMLRQLWKLRQKYIRPEVHKKLHPLV